MKHIELKLAKRLMVTVLTDAILGPGAFATNVRAHVTRGFEIQVPFDFVIEERTSEAGRYRIGRLDDNDPDMMILKTAGGPASAIEIVNRVALCKKQADFMP